MTSRHEPAPRPPQPTEVAPGLWSTKWDLEPGTAIACVDAAAHDIIKFNRLAAKTPESVNRWGLHCHQPEVNGRRPSQLQLIEPPGCRIKRIAKGVVGFVYALDDLFGRLVVVRIGGDLF